MIQTNWRLQYVEQHQVLLDHLFETGNCGNLSKLFVSELNSTQLSFEFAERSPVLNYIWHSQFEIPIIQVEKDNKYWLN